MWLKDKLSVKTVDFMGDGLLAAQDKDGIIWTGVNSFCQGIGLNKNERDRQVKNVQSDEVLKTGCVNLTQGCLIQIMKHLRYNLTMFLSGLPKYQLRQT